MLKTWKCKSCGHENEFRRRHRSRVSITTFNVKCCVCEVEDVVTLEASTPVTHEYLCKFCKKTSIIKRKRATIGTFMPTRCPHCGRSTGVYVLSPHEQCEHPQVEQQPDHTADDWLEFI